MAVFLSKFLYITVFAPEIKPDFFLHLYAHSQTKSDGIASSTADA